MNGDNLALATVKKTTGQRVKSGRAGDDKQVIYFTWPIPLGSSQDSISRIVSHGRDSIPLDKTIIGCKPQKGALAG